MQDLSMFIVRTEFSVHRLTNKNTKLSIFQVYAAKNSRKLTQTETERSRLPIAQHVYGTACANQCFCPIEF